MCASQATAEIAFRAEGTLQDPEVQEEREKQQRAGEQRQDHGGDHLQVRKLRSRRVPPLCHCLVLVSNNNNRRLRGSASGGSRVPGEAGGEEECHDELVKEECNDDKGFERRRKCP